MLQTVIGGRKSETLSRSDLCRTGDGHSQRRYDSGVMAGLHNGRSGRAALQVAMAKREGNYGSIGAVYERAVISALDRSQKAGLALVGVPLFDRDGPDELSLALVLQGQW
jgi:hypothetical protein